MALVAKGNRLTIRAVPGTIFFAPETKQNERRQNFLKNVTFVAKYKVRLILGFDFDKKSIYKFRLKNETVNIIICDFSLPFFRTKESGLYFDQFKFFCEDAPSPYKKLLKPQNNRVGSITEWFNYIEDAFILDKEKATKNLL